VSTIQMDPARIDESVSEFEEQDLQEGLTPSS
jgi:hypothetical protein